MAVIQRKKTATADPPPRPPPKKKKRKKLISPATWNAVGVVICAILAAVGWNYLTREVADGKIRSFLTSICRPEMSDIHAYCSDVLEPARRTQQVTHFVDPGTRLVSIPRSRQLWDLDALRSDLGKHLLTASSPDEPIDPIAFLSAHLATMKFKLEDNTTDSGISTEMAEYLQILPTKEDFEGHPVTWTQKKRWQHLNGTGALEIVEHLQKTIADEYQKFADASLDFDKQITKDDYLISRLTVLTRNFATGTITEDEANDGETLEDELKRYLEEHGVDLTKGSHALVPILDQYHHHNVPNVRFGYDSKTKAFEIIADRGIEPGSELWDMYGKHTDSDLFAKYGFVNGDGSDFIQGDVAIFHSPFGMTQEPPMIQALRYLQYDDGYESCIDEKQEEAWEFKKLKLRSIKNLLFEKKRWIAHFHPPNPSSKPGPKSSEPITLSRSSELLQVRFDGRYVVGTCRLMSLTHHDFNGTGIEQLKQQVDDASYVIPETDKALEFRTMNCMARMSSTAIQQIGGSAIRQAKECNSLTRTDFQSTQWYVAHVKLGELQTLDAMQRMAFSSIRQMEEEMGDIKEDPRYQMRNDPCGVEYLEPLFKAVAQEENS